MLNVTHNLKALPAIVRRTCKSIGRQQASDPDAPDVLPLPEWCDFVRGTEDMKNAYRQCPIAPYQRRCAVVAFWDEASEQIQFIVPNGLPVGLSSAVLNFHRTPVLLTAVARRMTGCAAAYFFDDSGVVGLVAGHGFAQAILRDIYSMAGAALDPGKSQAPAGCRVFLGLSANLALVSIGGLVEYWLGAWI